MSKSLSGVSVSLAGAVAAWLESPAFHRPASSVQRIWAANDIKPHLTRTFKLSNDPNFEDKFWDVIGLYLAPPDKALVLCCDEKSQVQALQRTQPLPLPLPLGIGHIRTQTHDYVRHGKLTLFATMDYLQGRLISSMETQHRYQKWLAFLKEINQPPKGLQLHLIVDNYATHKHGQGMAQATSAISHALHPDIKLLDEHG